MIPAPPCSILSAMLISEDRRSQSPPATRSSARLEHRDRAPKTAVPRRETALATRGSNRLFHSHSKEFDLVLGVPCDATSPLLLTSLAIAPQRYSEPSRICGGYQKTVVTANLDNVGHFHGCGVTDGNSKEISSDSTESPLNRTECPWAATIVRTVLRLTSRSSYSSSCRMNSSPRIDKAISVTNDTPRRLLPAAVADLRHVRPYLISNADASSQKRGSNRHGQY